MSNPQVPISGSIGAAGPFPTLGVTLVTLADADHTLAIPSETCYQYIKVTGTLTAARNLVGPLNGGFTFFVYNDTVGGFDVNVGGSSGAKVPVPPGSVVCCIATDGVNYLQSGEQGPPGAFFGASTIGATTEIARAWTSVKALAGTTGNVYKLTDNDPPIAVDESIAAAARLLFQLFDGSQGGHIERTIQVVNL